MRGADGYTETMFTMAKLDDFVPANHPLRPIRLWLNDALKRMDGVFARIYESDAKGGRPSVAIAACCIGLGTSWNAFSVVSNIFVVSPLATTSLQVTISLSLRLRVPLDRW